MAAARDDCVRRRARREIDTRFELEPDASLIAWDISCLGRPAIGERLTRGCIEQRLSVTRRGEPLLLERARYDGGSDALSAAWGLGAQPVTGTLLCVGGARPAELVPELRGALSRVAAAETACTELAHALVCRYRGGSVERAQLAFRRRRGRYCASKASRANRSRRGSGRPDNRGP